MTVSKISREQIFAAAKNIANTQGLKKVTVRNVASECGVSIGSVYNYYETKGELVFEVARDYWLSIFDREQISKLPQENFCDFIGALYGVIAAKLSGFMRQWISVMSNFSEEDKSLGRAKEAEIFSDVKKLLRSAMENDAGINKEIWRQGFDKEEMLDFIFSNMLNLMRRGSADCQFLIKVLRRTLY